MKKIIILILLLLLTPTLVNAETKYLYDVLKNEAETGGLAREYTGEHHDSFTKEPSKKIYHWYAPTGTNGNNIANEINEKNNVIFANHCWKMIRTTDTGGVKMLYNGEAEDTKCLDTRENHLGYNSAITQNLANTYWYGDDYTYDKENNSFTLSGTTGQYKWNSENWNSLIGKYTCKLSSETSSCQTLYLVESYANDNNAYVIPISNSSNYSTYGKLPFNNNDNSAAYIGYMYGDVYPSTGSQELKNQSFSTSIRNMINKLNVNTNIWFADSVSYNSSTSKYTLVNPYKIDSDIDYSSLLGKYTFISTNENYENVVAYYIFKVDNSNIYSYALRQGHDFEYFNIIAIGDSITDNNDGTYTVNNTTNITLDDWIDNYNNYIEKYTCNNSDTVCTNPEFIIKATRNNYTFYDAGEKILIAKNRNGNQLLDTLKVRTDEWYKNYSNYKNEGYKYTCNSTQSSCDESLIRIINTFDKESYYYMRAYYWGNSVTWNGNEYTIVDPIEISGLDDLATHHFRCSSPSTTTCSSVYYVYSYSQWNFNKMFRIELKNGVLKASDALNSMLRNNTTNSTIKTGLESWYKKYMINYDEFIEDTIYCNNRKLDSINGWDSNSPTTGLLNYPESDTPASNRTNSLKCELDTDKFSTKNNSAKLNYKVGLISVPEIDITGNIKTYETDSSYWTISPRGLYDRTGGYHHSSSWAMFSSGGLFSDSMSSANYVKPVISLKSKLRYLSGNGSKDNPYVVDLTNYYSIGVEINNETEDLTVEIEDLSKVEEGETVNFTIKPIKGRKVTSIRIVDENNNEIDYTITNNNYTFTMPDSDVTIIPNYERVKNAVNVEDNINTKDFVIEVNDATAVVYEDTVRFRIDPEEGYEVDKIDITDEENNNISYRKTNNINEYEFTMPDTNVLIKPYYRLLPNNNGNIPNPNTKRQILLIVISVLILVIITILFIKKKKHKN